MGGVTAGVSRGPVISGGKSQAIKNSYYYYRTPKRVQLNFLCYAMFRKERERKHKREKKNLCCERLFPCSIQISNKICEIPYHFLYKKIGCTKLKTGNFYRSRGLKRGQKL
jgi:hypothetical protein